jgi:hypothetical protein
MGAVSTSFGASGMETIGKFCRGRESKSGIRDGNSERGNQLGGPFGFSLIIMTRAIDYR